MTMSILNKKVETFRALIDGAARAMVELHHEEVASFVTVPVLYPSGSTVTVRIEIRHSGRYLVSDMGLGLEEADLVGASRQFANLAPGIAGRAGVHFDAREFAVAADSSQLAGAISVIASCSQESAQLAVFKFAEKGRADAADRLCERLFRVFTPAQVEREATVVGASNTEWTVTALVRENGHKAIYEPVSNHPNSVAAVLTKFVDVNQLEKPPARIAVVGSKEALGTRLALIATAGSVVEESVSDAALRKSAISMAA